jgi:protein-disulfide isomerase
MPVTEKLKPGMVTPASRRLVIAGAAAGLGLALIAHGATAQKRAPAGEVDMAELLKPGDLPDLAIGPATAKVTIVEYASLTCPHCASFHNKVYPALKAKYVDTGKVRFIYRDFPLQDLAAAGSMLARCAGPDKASGVIGVLFQKQDQWAFVTSNPAVKLFEIAKQLGFTQEAFDKCLTDQKLLDQIEAGRKRASEKFQVSSTPTFFINGKRLSGASDQLATFDKALEPLLKD